MNKIMGGGALYTGAGGGWKIIGEAKGEHKVGLGA